MADLTAVEIFDTATGQSTGEALTSANMRGHHQKAANRTEWLKKRLDEVVGTEQEVESVDATANTITITAHGYINTDAVRLISVGGTVPAGLSAGTVYYVRDKTNDTFKLATEPAGSVIDITGAGSGTIYVFDVPDPTGWGFLLEQTEHTFTVSQTFTNGVIISGSTATEHSASADFTGLTTMTRAKIGMPDTSTITGAGNQDLSIATSNAFLAGTPSGNRTLTLLSATPTPMAGEELTITRVATGNFTYAVKKSGGTDPMATLAALTHCSATFKFVDSQWVLWHYTPGVTVGAEAGIV